MTNPSTSNSSTYLELQPGVSYSAKKLAKFFEEKNLHYNAPKAKNLGLICFASPQEREEEREVHYLFLPNIAKSRSPVLNLHSVCGNIARLEYYRIPKKQKDIFAGEILNPNCRSVFYHLLIEVPGAKHSYLYCGEGALFHSCFLKKSWAYNIQFNLSNASSVRKVLTKHLGLNDRNEILSEFPLSPNRTIPFPQADDLEKVMLLAEAVLDMECLGLPFEFPEDLGLEERQHAYYANAGRYLNIFHENSATKEIKVTSFGIFLLLSAPQKRNILLQNILYKEKAFECGFNSGSMDEITKIISDTCPNPSSGESYSLSVCKRRARSVLSWCKELRGPVRVQRDSLFELKSESPLEDVSVLVKNIKFKEDITWKVLDGYGGPIRSFQYSKTLSILNDNLILSFNNSYKEVFAFFWVIASRDVEFIRSYLAEVGVEGQEVASEFAKEDSADPFALMRTELRVSRGRLPKRAATEFAQTIDDNMAFKSEAMKSALIEYYALPTGRGRLTIARKYDLVDREFVREIKYFGQRIKKEAAQYFGQDLFDILSDGIVEWKEIAKEGWEPESSAQEKAYISVTRFVLTRKDSKEQYRIVRKQLEELCSTITSHILFEDCLFDAQEIFKIAQTESPVFTEGKSATQCFIGVARKLINENKVTADSINLGYLKPRRRKNANKKRAENAAKKLPESILRWAEGLHSHETFGFLLVDQIATIKELKILFEKEAPSSEHTWDEVEKMLLEVLGVIVRGKKLIHR